MAAKKERFACRYDIVDWVVKRLSGELTGSPWAAAVAGLSLADGKHFRKETVTATGGLRIAVVLARPYQAFQGGDGAYLDALLKHLRASGHELIGLTSSTTRGRFRPIVKLIYSHWLCPGWRFRGAAAIGDWRVLLSPSALLQLARDAFGVLHNRAFPDSWTWIEEPGELRWISRQVRALDAQVTIFCFEAAAMIPSLADNTRKLALVGFLPHRVYALESSGKLSVKSDGDLPRLLRAGLVASDAVAVNNTSDRIWWEEDSESRNQAIVVGMSPMPFHASQDSSEKIVLFVGNKTAPNITGLDWFLSEVWPLVIAQQPDARLRVVGRVAEQVKEAHPGVDLVGKVTNISEEYIRARAVVVPLTNGSAGVKTKLVEAIAHGRAFVATAVAIEPEQRERIADAGYVVDDAPSFSRSLQRLLVNDDDRYAKQSGARDAYNRFFSSAAAYSQLDGWLSRVG